MPTKEAAATLQPGAHSADARIGASALDMTSLRACLYQARPGWLAARMSSSAA